jgi:hypothetical protein
MTLYVNLYAGPGAGKSTTAADTFAKLKRLGINCELITEFAKDKVWEGHEKVFTDQLYLLGKQHWKQYRLEGEVDVAITDSPLILSLVYNRLYAKLEHMDPLVLEVYGRFNNLNYFLTRSKAYNPKGRNQTEEEAKGIDGITRGVLDEFGIPYTDLAYDLASDLIVKDVLAKLGN